MKHIEVVAAIIIHKNQFLCMQRKESKYDYISKKFEFPGGKVETNETLEKALNRELNEEMNIRVDVQKKDFFLTVNYTYPDFEITMHSFIVRIANPTFEMKDHIAHKWLPKNDLLSLDWAAADLPIVKKIIEVL